MSKKQSSDAVPVTRHLDQLRNMLEEAEIEFEEGATADRSFSDYIQVETLMFLFDGEGSLVQMDDVGE